MDKKQQLKMHLSDLDYIAEKIKELQVMVNKYCIAALGHEVAVDPDNFVYYAFLNLDSAFYDLINEKHYIIDAIEKTNNE